MNDIIKKAEEIFNDSNFQTTIMIVGGKGFAFETQYGEDEDIHGRCEFIRKDITIATCNTYRSINDTKKFIKRLNEVLECCEKVNELMDK